MPKELWASVRPWLTFKGSHPSLKGTLGRSSGAFYLDVFFSLSLVFHIWGVFYHSIWGTRVLVLSLVPPLLDLGNWVSSWFPSLVRHFLEAPYIPFCPILSLDSVGYNCFLVLWCIMLKQICGDYWRWPEQLKVEWPFLGILQLGTIFMGL